ncbi:F-box protein At1g70590 [Amborella trichopoda]|uniref:F-box domain-containing protein n=1 Tax=Amborella trichopoda TaxID=13333 RepID=W1PH03_AMBTC|nr:F-box protein At1g70590 [Amborella trichopoda]XP_020523466.1 F-box protein At1g70590 [Amborella trichopoda]ERN06916.1 hypothetical protein AMTR_s00005p00259500 [Amborella trichopoda]|eukprot:XP_006845241.1 F-box protein At1g70590 [Amborella trichopoda]
MEQRTWPPASDGCQFPRLFSSIPTHKVASPRSSIRPKKSSKGSATSCNNKLPLNPNFSALPFDVLRRLASSFTVTDLWAASRVCRSWREGLQPLREAMVLVRWGKRFKHGMGGVRRNLNKALDSFLKAAAHGSAAAMVDAGLIFWEMGKKDDGIALYRKAAALGDPAGQCNLGLSYLQVDPPNPEEAVRWFYKAAFAGHVGAKYSLALCLQQGRGVACNRVEAARWYLRAAEGGNARAMYNTALCYLSGEGISRNYQLARKWMKRAADFGHRKAQYEHGLSLFSEGEKTMALVYLELASRAGETAAAHIKDVLVQQLSPSMRACAMSSADNWHALRAPR